MRHCPTKLDQSRRVAFAGTGRRQTVRVSGSPSITATAWVTSRSIEVAAMFLWSSFLGADTLSSHHRKSLTDATLPGLRFPVRSLTEVELPFFKVAVFGGRPVIVATRQTMEMLITGLLERACHVPHRRRQGSRVRAKPNERVRRSPRRPAEDDVSHSYHVNEGHFQRAKARQSRVGSARWGWQSRRNR